MREILKRYFSNNGRNFLQLLLVIAVGFLIYTVVSLTETIRNEQKEHRRQAESALHYLETITEENKKNTEAHRERNEEVHTELENLICDIIMRRPASDITDGQRKACEEIKAR